MNESDEVWAVFRYAHPSIYDSEIVFSGHWPYLKPQPRWDDYRMRFDESTNNS